jgi:hypothetical protein
VAGREYTLHILTSGGESFLSTPQKINPVGTVDALSYELVNGSGNHHYSRDNYYVKLFADASLPDGEKPLLYWRWKGTYEIKTEPLKKVRKYPDPELRGHGELPDTPPCSGFIFVKKYYLERGILFYPVGGVCTCCICWVNNFPEYPVVHDPRFSTGRLTGLPVGEVPVNNTFFQDGKYHVEVEMMSVSREVYDFWSRVAVQKKGNSLFQPPYSRPAGNIRSEGGTTGVYGVFSASAVSRKSFFLTYADLPFPIQRDTIVMKDDCRKYRNSSNHRPDFWQ